MAIKFLWSFFSHFFGLFLRAGRQQAPRDPRSPAPELLPEAPVLPDLLRGHEACGELPPQGLRPDDMSEFGEMVVCEGANEHSLPAVLPAADHPLRDRPGGPDPEENGVDRRQGGANQNSLLHLNRDAG